MNTVRKRSYRSAALLGMCGLAAIFPSSCAKTNANVEIAGKVALDGKNIEKGVISFVSTDARSGAVVAQIVGGRYSAKLLPGQKQVRISSLKVVGRREITRGGGPRMVDVTQEVVPEQYNQKSTLQIEITTDSVNKDVDFNL